MASQPVPRPVPRPVPPSIVQGISQAFLGDAPRGLLAVILHYGDVALTQRVHERLVHALDASAGDTVLVLDNAAPQPYGTAGPIVGPIVGSGTAEPSIAGQDTVRLPQNIYWGGGLAYALRLALERGKEYLWFCNNDITVRSPAEHIPLLPYVRGRLGYMCKKLGQPVGVLAPCVTHNAYHPHMRQRPQADFCRAAYVDGIAPVLHVPSVLRLGAQPPAPLDEPLDEPLGRPLNGPLNGLLGEHFGGPCDAILAQALDMGDNVRGYGVDVWLSWRMQAAGMPVLVDHTLCLRHTYHSTAQQVAGFMEQAAQDEAAYMTARLGPAWRTRLQACHTPKSFAPESFTPESFTPESFAIGSFSTR